MIPKTIYQVFNTLDLPEILAKNVEKIKALNPSWTHRLFTNDESRDFIADLYDGKHVDIYDKINPLYGAVKSDWFRHLVIYKMGGVYLDIKGTFNKPLDSFILPDDECILSHWTYGFKLNENNSHPELRHIPDGEYIQWFMIYSQHHPFVAAMIERMMANFKEYTPEKYGTGKPGALRLAGPIPYTLAIEPILNLHKHRFIKYWEEGIQYSIIENWDQNAVKVIPNHYARQTGPIML
jgi:inositol phosphorylceramide mannosyltransferase catalytic subunit